MKPPALATGPAAAAQPVEPRRRGAGPAALRTVTLAHRARRRGVAWMAGSCGHWHDVAVPDDAVPGVAWVAPTGCGRQLVRLDAEPFRAEWRAQMSAGRRATYGDITPTYATWVLTRDGGRP